MVHWLYSQELAFFYTAIFDFMYCISLVTCKNYCKNIKSEQYPVSDTKLLKSGDIEMNPGPIENISPQNNDNVY